MASPCNERRDLEGIIALLQKHDPAFVVSSGIIDHLRECLERIQAAESVIRASRSELVSLSNTIRHSLDHCEIFPVSVRAPSNTDCFVEKDYEREVVYPLQLKKFVSPLTEPLLRGWRRVFLDDGTTTDSSGPRLYYISPKGTRLMTLREIEKYLVKDYSQKLSIDQFTMDKGVSLHSKPLPKECWDINVFISDIALGTEHKPIPCFNCINKATPSPFQYISSFVRSTEADVTVPTERSFMLSCDCKDGCVSSNRCVCRQLTTTEGMRVAELQGHKGAIGYEHQRLLKQQISGIYECNQYCGCGPNCTNRVVQRGLRHRLAVFRTEKMGWGVMTMDDIPRGTFLCTYNGLVCNDATGNSRAIKYGDEYLTELDYIEVMEDLKEGYEEDVVSLFCDEPSKVSSKPLPPGGLYLVTEEKESVHTPNDLASLIGSDGRLRSTSNETFTSSVKTHFKSPPLEETTSSPEISPIISCSDSSSVFANKMLDDEVSSDSAGEGGHDVIKIPTRHHYREQHCYVIDSKSQGNIGRFINHSCSPNLFVQNVFVDTHDLRFPWVAFFASRNIPAFSEVFWDYSYIVGSVEGRTMECLCGSSNCRKRLL